MKKYATISADEKYRYSLSRVWDYSKPGVMFIMLNPSTADANLDDPTIRRCISFAKSWGYGSIHVGNLFAFRSTNPKELLKEPSPVGEFNQKYLRRMSALCDIAVCAWGNSPILKKLNQDHLPLSVVNIPFFTIDLSNDGTPKHPLYLKGNLKPKPITALNRTMRKEIHIINGTGPMKQCDQFPENSIQMVNVDSDGIRWTAKGVNSIHPDIGSKVYELGNKLLYKCDGCNNLFTEDATLKKNKCSRCIERKTLVNRT